MKILKRYENYLWFICIGCIVLKTSFNAFILYCVGTIYLLLNDILKELRK